MFSISIALGKALKSIKRHAHQRTDNNRNIFHNFISQAQYTIYHILYIYFISNTFWKAIFIIIIIALPLTKKHSQKLHNNNIFHTISLDDNNNNNSNNNTTNYNKFLNFCVEFKALFTIQKTLRLTGKRRR